MDYNMQSLLVMKGKAVKEDHHHHRLRAVEIRYLGLNLKV